MQVNVVPSRLIRYFFLFGICFFYSVFADLPPPTMTVMVPMRDGTELPTDLYLPVPEARDLPCILLCSPGGREIAVYDDYDVIELVAQGYVIAVLETRSAKDTEGKTLPYVQDRGDVHDAIKWLAKSEYTNGRIAMAGTSAKGIVELIAAPDAPKELIGQYVRVGCPNLYQHCIFPGGVLRKNQVEGWLGHYARDPSVIESVKSKSMYNEFWENLDAVKAADHIHVGGVHVGGWYDTFIQGTIDAFVSRQFRGGEGARGKQRLVIGPWSHFWPRNRQLGDFPVPEEGLQVPYDISLQRWAECCLKGVDNGFESLPTVIYYVMGPFDGSTSKGHVWKTADTWPIPHEPLSIYLTADSGIRKTSSSREQSVSFSYDLDHPVPTVGGRHLFLESGTKDQREIEKRDDVLVFTSEPLKEDLEVTGKITAQVFVSSNCPDTDVVVRLCDVYPDGRSMLVVDGIGRAKNLGRTLPREVEVDLLSTSMVFAKGHSLRISVTSTNYPCFDKISSRPSDGLVAQNTIYLGGAHASRVILPVVN